MIRRLRNLFRLGVILLAITAGAVVWKAQEMLAQHGNGTSLKEPVEITIVLASGVDPDLVLGFSSRRRVTVGVDLLLAGKTERLLMSGGPISGAEGTVAALMKDYAMVLGAREDQTLVETRSRTTFENLRFSKEIVDGEGASRIALLTDDMHLSRSALLAEFFGLEISGLVAARGMTSEPILRRITSVTREAMAWWYNLGKVAIWWSMNALGYDETTRETIVSKIPETARSV